MEKFLYYEIKELGDDGSFSGYLSTFNNVDAGGDLIEPGAFKKTLRDIKAFPFLWSHQGSLPTIIGSFQGDEDDKGLKINGSFLPDEDSQKARRKIKTLIERGVFVGLSIGYKAIKFLYEKIEETVIRRIKEIKLYEGSGTLFPMNVLARLRDVKSEGEEPGSEDCEQKPFPSEHSCRLKDPGQFERFARMTRSHEGKKFSVIIGFKKGGGSEDQAYRYPKDTWSADAAKKHCKDHGGSFEAAAGKNITLVCESCGETLILTQPAEATEPGSEPPKSEPSNAHSVLLEIADNFKSK